LNQGCEESHLTLEKENIDVSSVG